MVGERRFRAAAAVDTERVAQASPPCRFRVGGGRRPTRASDRPALATSGWIARCEPRAFLNARSPEVVTSRAEASGHRKYYEPGRLDH